VLRCSGVYCWIRSGLSGRINRRVRMLLVMSIGCGCLLRPNPLIISPLRRDLDVVYMLLSGRIGSSWWTVYRARAASTTSSPTTATSAPGASSTAAATCGMLKTSAIIAFRTSPMLLIIRLARRCDKSI
jgi:hypothetical protein